MDALGNRLKIALGSAYELGPELGRGGMAVVYRATDRRLRREVAIKVLPPELGYSPELRRRFVREAQLAAQLSHPNIVPIYDVGERDDLVWFIMALVEGESVRAKVEREGAQPLTVVRRVLEQAAQALAYAHAKGVIHRDIKPDNILMERASGRALVTDFGIAKALHGADTDVTKPGEIVGTVRYMAPEQAAGAEHVDARADIYSLGLVGYFLLAGQHALKGATLPAIITEHVRGVKIDFTALGRRVPPTLASALARCVAPDPADRFVSLEEFAEELRDLGGDLPDLPAPVRMVLRESERTFVIGTVGAFALGFIGVENVPLALIAIVGGGFLGQWAAAIEHARRQGIGWADLRRALYIERNRRLEEARLGQKRRLGIASAATMVIGIGGGFLLVSQVGGADSSLVNIALFFGGAFGGLIAAKLFGMPRVESPPGSRFDLGRVTLPVAAWSCAVIAALVVFIGLQQGMPLNEIAALLVALAFAGVLVAGVVIGIYRLVQGIARKLGAATSEEDRVENWKIPQWLDVAGSWLFARVRLEGWRIRIERDRPAAIDVRVDLGEARKLAHEIDLAHFRLQSGLTGALLQRATSLAEELVRDCEGVNGKLRPLAAKMARLNDGALVSHTLGGGGGVDSELDRAEAEVDGLRARADENLEILRALKAGSDVAVAAHDASALEQALARLAALRDKANAAKRQADTPTPV